MAFTDLPPDAPDRPLTGATFVADGLSVRDGDRAWARAAVRACADGPRLLGVHVITHDGSREVPAPLAQD